MSVELLNPYKVIGYSDIEEGGLVSLNLLSEGDIKKALKKMLLLYAPDCRDLESLGKTGEECDRIYRMLVEVNEIFSRAELKTELDRELEEVKEHGRSVGDKLEILERIDSKLRARSRQLVAYYEEKFAARVAMAHAIYPDIQHSGFTPEEFLKQQAKNVWNFKNGNNRTTGNGRTSNSSGKSHNNHARPSDDIVNSEAVKVANGLNQAREEFNKRRHKEPVDPEGETIGGGLRTEREVKKPWWKSHKFNERNATQKEPGTFAGENSGRNDSPNNRKERRGSEVAANTTQDPGPEGRFDFLLGIKEGEELVCGNCCGDGRFINASGEIIPCFFCEETGIRRPN